MEEGERLKGERFVNREERKKEEKEGREEGGEGGGKGLNTRKCQWSIVGARM
jgi:hypothetical protein